MALAVVALTFPRAAVANQILDSTVEPQSDSPIEMRCGALLVDSDAGTANYYIKFGVAFRNDSAQTITSIQFGFDIVDGFGTVLGSRSGEMDGTYSTGANIMPRSNIMGVMQPQFSAINIWPSARSVRCRVLRARYADGSIWTASLIVPHPSPAASDSTNYGYPVLGIETKGAPLVVLAASGRVEDSSVGNQSFYSVTCFLAKNVSGKEMTVERYELRYVSPFKENLGVRYSTLRHQIAPHSDDVFPGRNESECLRMVNPWGSNVDHVYFKPVEALFSDGSVWKASGDETTVTLTSPDATPTPTVVTPDPNATPPAMPPWSGPSWSAPGYLKPTPSPSP